MIALSRLTAHFFESRLRHFANPFAAIIPQYVTDLGCSRDWHVVNEAGCSESHLPVRIRRELLPQ
jgi:hypothetical protein